MKKNRVFVAMPAHNEEDAIGMYIREIRQTFSEHFDTSILVVDDCSDDSTIAVAQKEGALVFTNPQNLGHGPSYLRAISLASQHEPDFIIATDGDGQCSALDLLELVRKSLQSGEICIGKRVARREPFYRRVTTVALSIMCSIRTRRQVLDPNSPHRVFPIKLVDKYIGHFSGAELIPNVLGSLILAKKGRLAVLSVTHRERLGDGGQGKTWKARGRGLLPPRRFVRFIAAAWREFWV